MAHERHFCDACCQCLHSLSGQLMCQSPTAFVTLHASFKISELSLKCLAISEVFKVFAYKMKDVCRRF